MTFIYIFAILQNEGSIGGSIHGTAIWHVCRTTNGMLRYAVLRKSKRFMHLVGKFQWIYRHCFQQNLHFWIHKWSFRKTQFIHVKWNHFVMLKLSLLLLPWISDTLQRDLNDNKFHTVWIYRGERYSYIACDVSHVMVFADRKVSFSSHKVMWGLCYFRRLQSHTCRRLFSTCLRSSILDKDNNIC